MPLLRFLHSLSSEETSTLVPRSKHLADDDYDTLAAKRLCMIRALVVRRDRARELQRPTLSTLGGAWRSWARPSAALARLAER